MAPQRQDFIERSTRRVAKIKVPAQLNALALEHELHLLEIATALIETHQGEEVVRAAIESASTAFAQQFIHTIMEVSNSKH